VDAAVLDRRVGKPSVVQSVRARAPGQVPVAVRGLAAAAARALLHRGQRQLGLQAQPRVRCQALPAAQAVPAGRPTAGVMRAGPLRTAPQQPAAARGAVALAHRARAGSAQAQELPRDALQVTLP